MVSTRVNDKIAQSIVDAVYEVCRSPINFINQEGYIIASTDKSRVHQFHEIGQKVIKQAKPIFIQEDEKISGCKTGVNYPIFMDGEVVAAIGITGKPDEVSKYGFLATKISEVFIRELYFTNKRNSTKQKMNYLIRAYIYNHIENENYISNLRREFKLSEGEYHIIYVSIHDRYHMNNIGMVKHKIKELFLHIQVTCYTFLYPNGYVGFLKDEHIDWAKKEIMRFSHEIAPIAKIGIGTAKPLKRVYKSYEEAKYTIKCIEDKPEYYKLYSELGLESLLRILCENVSHRNLMYVLANVNEEEKKILSSFYQNNMSLKDTAAEHFIHINTLQNKLNRIEEKNGLNPRIFKDAVALYLGIKVEEMQR